jgi:peroxiredoxin
MKQVFPTIIAILVVASGSTTVAQNAWIKGKLNGFSGSDQTEWVFLSRSGLLRTTETVDSVPVNGKGEFAFVNSQDVFPAIYQLRLNNGTAVSFLCATKGLVNVSSNATDLFYGKAKVEAGIEHELYEELERIQQQNLAAMKSSGVAYDAIDFFDPKYNTKSESVRAEYEAVLGKSNKKIGLLMNENSETFVANVLAPLYYNPLKSQRIQTDTLYDNNLAFQHNHFFDKTNLNDMRVASFDVYYDRLDEYMQNYADGSSLDGLKSGVGKIMDRITDTDVRAAVAIYLSGKAKDVQQYDLADHILDTYYSSGCNIAVSNNWNEIVSTIRAASVGSLAPELVLPQENGKEFKLSSLNGKKAVLLYFWSSTCQYCLDGLPELKQFYTNRAAKGFDIYAVSLDQDKGVWRQFVEAVKLPWVNVCDGRGTEGVYSKYGSRLQRNAGCLYRAEPC